MPGHRSQLLKCGNRWSRLCLDCRATFKRSKIASPDGLGSERSPAPLDSRDSASTQGDCRGSLDTYFPVKKDFRRPLLFGRLIRKGGEGTVNPEGLFADSRASQTETGRDYKDRLHASMRGIPNWAILFLSGLNRILNLAIY